MCKMELETIQKSETVFESFHIYNNNKVKLKSQSLIGAFQLVS